jgi:hypothetical protein
MPVQIEKPAASQTIEDLVPKADDLLKLEIEDVADILLAHLKERRPAGFLRLWPHNEIRFQFIAILQKSWLLAEDSVD